jgi:hypothetical protein
MHHSRFRLSQLAAIAALSIVILGTACSAEGDDEPSCGNGICDEDGDSCPFDCPTVEDSPDAGTCGNAVCDQGETAASCTSDCGCGNGVCEEAETNATCAADCPRPATVVIDNSTRFTMRDLHARSCSNGSLWGDDDLLAGDPIGPYETGQSVTIKPGCYFFQIVASDGVRESVYETSSPMDLFSGRIYTLQI